MDYADFQFYIDDPLSPRLVVNGEDVTERCVRVAVDVQAGAVPKLHLEQDAGQGKVEGRGVVHVHHEAADPEQVVIDWLTKIDPAQLEREALHGANMGSKKTGELFLDALRARARGEAPGG